MCHLSEFLLIHLFILASKNYNNKQIMNKTLIHIFLYIKSTKSDLFVVLTFVIRDLLWRLDSSDLT